MVDVSKDQEAFTVSIDRWETFINLSDQKQSELATLYYHAPLLYGEVWQRLIDPSQEVLLTFLGVGDGKVELLLTKGIIANRREEGNLKIYCEDVSGPLKATFLENAEELKLAKLITDYRLARLEDPEFIIPDSDLIIASHMFYYVNGWRGDDSMREGHENPLIKINRAIKMRKGVAVIVMQTKTSEVYSLREKNSGSNKESSTEDVVEELRRLEMPYRVFTTDATLDVSCLFPEGSFNPTEEGKALLSFIFRTSWESLPPEKRQAIKQHLEEILNTHSGEALARERFTPYWLRQVDGYVSMLSE